MYKVFINDKPIIITDSCEKLNGFKVFNFRDIDFKQVLKLINTAEVFGLFLVSRSLKSDWLMFQKNFTVIEAAGGKVLNTENHVLFIYRYNVWDLPKGHIEKGELKEHAAIREVEEECGIDNLSILEALETTYHVFYYGEQLRLKVTYWFLMKSSYKGVLQPQLEEGITKAVFKNRQDVSVALKNTYPNIKLLFQ